MAAARRLVTLVVLGSLVAGCGGGGSASPASSSTLATHVITADPATMVLDAGDIGGGFLAVPSQTGADTLAATMQQDSAATRSIERASWLSGYHALYAGGRADGVLTDAAVFRSSDAAVKVAGAWTGSELKAFHATMITPPASALSHLTMMRGTLPVQGGTATAYFVQWVHGNVLAGILRFGGTASPATLAGLATAQDGRIANAG